MLWGGCNSVPEYLSGSKLGSPGICHWQIPDEPLLYRIADAPVVGLKGNIITAIS